MEEDYYHKKKKENTESGKRNEEKQKSLLNNFRAEGWRVKRYQGYFSRGKVDKHLICAEKNKFYYVRARKIELKTNYIIYLNSEDLGLGDLIDCDKD